MKAIFQLALLLLSYTASASAAAASERSSLFGVSRGGGIFGGKDKEGGEVTE